MMRTSSNVVVTSLIALCVVLIALVAGTIYGAFHYGNRALIGYIFLGLIPIIVLAPILCGAWACYWARQLARSQWVELTTFGVIIGLAISGICLYFSRWIALEYIVEQSPQFHKLIV